MNNPYKNQIRMFDLSKGIAMILIIAIQTLVGYEFFTNSPGMWFWMFIAFPGTAALFLIMGYWYVPKPMKQLLSEIWHSALKIYIYTGICVILFHVIFVWTGYEGFTYLGQRMLGSIIGFLLGCQTDNLIGNVWIVEIGAMWYIFVYILGILILNLLLKVIPWKPVQMVVVFGIGFAGAFFGYKETLPFCITLVAAAIQTLYYGNFLRNNGFMNRSWKILDWFILIIGNVATCALYYVMYLNNPYGWEGMFQRAAMIFAVPAGIILLRICQFFQRWENVVTEVICTIGSKSVILMAILTVETLCFDWHKLQNLPYMQANPVFSCILILILRAIAYTGIVWMLPRLNIKFRDFIEKRKENKKEEKKKKK